MVSPKVETMNREYLIIPTTDIWTFPVDENEEAVESDE